MSPSWRTFVSIATACIVLAASAACACPWRGSHASTDAKPQPAHGCCEHQPTAPEVPAHHDGDHNCPHCNGSLVVTTLKAGNANCDLHRLDACCASPADVPVATAADLPPVSPAPVVHSPAPPTLLGLHCALNL